MTNEVEDGPGDDWDLELRVFGAANDDSLPPSTRDLFRELWRAYCAMEVSRDENATALRAQAERVRVLEGALETFAVLANEDTDYLPDEHVISLTYDDSDVDPELGGPNTLLGERFMRAFRRASALLPATQAENPQEPADE